MNFIGIYCKRSHNYIQTYVELNSLDFCCFKGCPNLLDAYSIDSAVPPIATDQSINIAVRCPNFAGERVKSKRDDSSDRYWCLCHLFVLEHAVTPGGTRFVIDHHSLSTLLVPFSSFLPLQRLEALESVNIDW